MFVKCADTRTQDTNNVVLGEIEMNNIHVPVGWFLEMVNAINTMDPAPIKDSLARHPVSAISPLNISCSPLKFGSSTNVAT